jgi:flavin-dependent dehydrogenase
MAQRTEYDAIVIGAGPAGASAAAILAEKGHRVALLEREEVGRYRVGESLIPFCWHPLNRLGLVEALDRSAAVVPKHSVQFASTDGRLSKPFYFSEHTDHPCAKTWQVVRSDFDKLLVDDATCKGATLLEKTAAREFLHAGEFSTVTGVKAMTAEGETLDLVAPITIDATGRDAMAQVHHRWRVPDVNLRKIAIWTYYRGALRDEGVDEGATTIAALPDKGWFWYIPLPDDLVSVGVVGDKEYLYRKTRSAARIFRRETRVQQWIRARIEPGERVDGFRVTSEFSNRSRYCASNGLVLVGDAYGFLDPVFSSGVYFALWSGVHAGEAVHEALTHGDTSAERFQAYGEQFSRVMEPMRRLVHAFYDDDFNFGIFLKSYPHFRDDLTDVLIGNLERDYDAFFAAVSEFAHLPKPIPFGGPLVGGH